MEQKSENGSKQEKGKVLVVHNAQCQLHASSRKHPQQPFRIVAVLAALPLAAVLEQEQLRERLGEDIAEQQVEALITAVHGQRYFQFVQFMWDESYKKSEMYINTDTYYMKHTFAAAFAAVKTVLLAVRALDNRAYQHVFAVVRPPGHHSGLKTQPHGFSFFNNVAIAAEYALRSTTFARVAIVDWDAHHGEGTQHIFYKRKDVLYLSLHRFDNGKFFPHVPQSSSQHCGEGDGLGFNINICWNLPEKKAGCAYERGESVGDEEYEAAFRRIIMPVLSQFAPDLVLVSCGFDSGDGDTIGNLKLSKAGYSMMTSYLKSLGKPLLAVLEGGYSEEVLASGSTAVLDALAADPLGRPEEPLGRPEEPLSSLSVNKIGEEGISRCIEEVGKLWNLE